MILLHAPGRNAKGTRKTRRSPRAARRCFAACASRRFGTSLPDSGAQKTRTGGAHRNLEPGRPKHSTVSQRRVSSRLRTRVETGRLGTSVAGGGKAWEAARGLGWDGNKGTGAGVGWGRGRARGLGFCTSLRPGNLWALAVTGAGQTYRQSLLPCIVAHFSFSFPRLATESPGPFWLRVCQKKRAIAPWGVLSWDPFKPEPAEALR